MKTRPTDPNILTPAVAFARRGEFYLKVKQMKTIEEIIELIGKNRKTIKPKYSDVYFSIDSDYPHDNNVYLFISTEYHKNPSKETIKKLEKIFDSEDVMFVDADDNDEQPNFWSIILN